MTKIKRTSGFNRTVLTCLRTLVEATASQIATVLSASPESVRKTLHRWKGKGVVKQYGHRWLSIEWRPCHRHDCGA